MSRTKRPPHHNPIGLFVRRSTDPTMPPPRDPTPAELRRGEARRKVEDKLAELHLRRLLADDDF